MWASAAAAAGFPPLPLALACLALLIQLRQHVSSLRFYFYALAKSGMRETHRSAAAQSFFLLFFFGPKCTEVRPRTKGGRR